MDKFRWAYIGSGNIAKGTAASILKGNHEIITVFGRNEEKVKKFAKRVSARACLDFDEAVSAEAVDAVYIATPHTSHLEYAQKAMVHGKPVLCEKPVGVSLSEVLKLEESAKASNVYFVEAMWTWFSDVALKVKQWVKDGEIGEIKEVVIDYAFPGVMMNKNSRVLTPETAGGALLDIGIYPITYCYNLFGYPSKIKCEGEIKGGIDVEETVLLSYDGFYCRLNMSLKTLKESCKIIGTKGEISLGFFHMASKATLNNENGKTVFRGKTDYLTEFTRSAEEIKAGKKQSDYVPLSATKDCMKIMDECRRQMNLVYPFEVNDNE